MLDTSPISPKELKDKIGNRSVYIWGARHEGFAATEMLKRHGITPAGFIDSSLSLAGAKPFGFSVQLPDAFFEANSIANSYIIIASGFYADEIAVECVGAGFKKVEDFIAYGELRRFNYQVDVAGYCNLKCISCPRGNELEHRPGGFMSAETYEKVLQKILKEDPHTGIVTLYNWGEPLLNKELPQIIKMTRDYGLHSAISTNLNINFSFEAVVAAKPTWFRISNSGWGENYEITHTGGKWELFLENLYKLKEYREKHHPEMLVEFFFHIYQHNREDYSKLQKLCDELDFTLRYRHAALAPLDNIRRVFDGDPVTEATQKTREIQFLKVEEVQEIAQSPEEKSRQCYYEDHLWINWDLQVAQCMEWYAPGLNLVEDDFLSTSLDALVAARKKNTFCEQCKAKGIHRAYTIYGDEKLITQKAALNVGRQDDV